MSVFPSIGGSADALPRHRSKMNAFLRVIIAISILIGGAYFFDRYLKQKEQTEVAETDLDRLAVALRENQNRLHVYQISGAVLTTREVRGGVGGVLKGRMTVKQPYSQSYFFDMKHLTLKDYIWDKESRTLTVRVPAVLPDSPNIDESKQVVSYKGPMITRDMQSRLRKAVAEGAQKQVADEARKPENIKAATHAARSAITENFEELLQAARIEDFRIVVRTPLDRTNGDTEQWDLSRSIEDVLAERATSNTAPAAAR